MHVTYRIEKQDWKSFENYFYRTNPMMKRFFLMMAILSFIQNFWELFVRLFESPGDYPQLIVMPEFWLWVGWKSLLFLVYLFFWVFSIVFFLFIYRTFFAPKDKFNSSFGEHRLYLRENEVYEETDVSKSSYAWKIIDRIEESKKFVIIFIDSTKVYVIPKRFFQNESHKTEFVTMCNEFLAKAKHSSARNVRNGFIEVSSQTEI